MATMKELKEFVTEISKSSHDPDCRRRFGEKVCHCTATEARDLLDNKHEFSYARNFKEFWKEHLFGHIPIGLLIGLTFNIPLAMLVAKRQELEYEKRDDTPGIDMAYHVGAASAGGAILLGLAIYMLLKIL